MIIFALFQSCHDCHFIFKHIAVFRQQLLDGDAWVITGPLGFLSACMGNG